MGASTRFLCAVTAALVLSMVAVGQIVLADVVYLTNGRTMEGIVLEEARDQVLLRLPYGEIGLPRSHVSKIVKGDSSLSEFLKRRRELEQRSAGAADWLELAVWAADQGLDHNARQTVLVAARLDPGLQSLAPFMTAMGYGYDQNLAVWLPYDELMRRRGFVLSDGRWLSPAEAEALERARSLERIRQQTQQRQDRVARAMEMMVLAQMAQAEESRRLRDETPVPTYGIPLWGSYPVVVPPAVGPRPPLGPKHLRLEGREGHARRASDRAYREGIVRRSPGSLIPVIPARGEGHRGGFQKSADPN